MLIGKIVVFFLFMLFCSFQIFHSRCVLPFNLGKADVIKILNFCT